MRICIVGKYPPIQGGVSARTYRYAHALARRGHEVHVITNAQEVQSPYRMLMQDEDWDRCDADYGPGYVRLHWTDPVDRSQSHIPMSSAFVSKLASVGAAAGAERNFDVVFAFYMEPYGIAGYLIAQMLNLPFVVKTAGSDAGRLWSHEQFEPLYDHVFRAADCIVAGGKVAEKLISIGIDKSRIRPDPDFTVLEDMFCPEGPALDVDAICKKAQGQPDFKNLQFGRFREDLQYFGLYGKLGENKGTYALLRAIAELVKSGRDVGLLVMGHEPPRAPQQFRELISELSLEEHVVQIPFVPNWRVPEFIRRCIAICCLEQDFPIKFHSPILPREVLCAGACLVGSTEVIRKLPLGDRLAHGYNCLAVNDVNDIDELSKNLIAVLEAPEIAAELGRRGRKYVADAQRDMKFPVRLEKTLRKAIATHGRTLENSEAKGNIATAQTLAEIAFNAMPSDQRRLIGDELGENPQEDGWAKKILAMLDARIDDGEAGLSPYRDAVKLDVCIAEASAPDIPDKGSSDEGDTLFRLGTDSQFFETAAIGNMVPTQLPHVALEKFEHDINAFLQAWMTGDFPSDLPRQESFAVILGQRAGRDVRTLVIDPATAAFLNHCDGNRTVEEIATKCREALAEQNHMKAWSDRTPESLLELGLIRLRRSN